MAKTQALPPRNTCLSTDTIVRFTNCLLSVNGHFVSSDLYINSTTGLILSSQDTFYNGKLKPSSTIDLDGRIISPGFIDVQINGAHGFDFSEVSEGDEAYEAGFKKVTQNLVRTGVTSFLPTITSQPNNVYEKALPYLGQSKRDPSLGTSSLGAHVEGPFLNPERNGIHPIPILQVPKGGLSSLEEVYGKNNLETNVKMITLAPELLPASSASALSSELASKDIVLSAGHSTATYSQLLSSNITMTTHLFNAMNQPQQREPGIAGAVLAEKSKTRYFGIIADGVHVHPANIRWAYRSNPDGCCLVTDAMSLLGLPDGEYDWTNGEKIIKTGGLLTLKGTTKIAGSCVTLLQCLNNFIRFAGVNAAEAIKTVTETPARLLGLEGNKGSLDAGADADLCILDLKSDGSLVVDEVWKFGVKVVGTERSKPHNSRVAELSRL